MSTVQGMQELRSDDEPMLAMPAPAQRRWVKIGGVVAIVAGALLVGFAALAHFAPAGQHAATEDVAELLEVAPPIEKCSKIGEHCGGTKCCTITGYKCYAKNAKFAGCLKSCPPVDGEEGTGSWSCDRPADLVPWKPSLAPPGTTLYCFEVYTKDTGSTKKNWDLSLIRTQLLTHASVFGCEAWDVFSDVTTWITPGPPQLFTKKVEAPHYGKRPKTGTWLNAGFFQNIWAKIKEDGKAMQMDWSVKVDPDTVWLPSRLRTKLSKQEVTDGGIYLTNCKHVKYGFFGSMAVASQKAVGAYLENLEDCKASLNWAKWGEDLFQQRCMDLHGADNVEDFELVTDGVCEAIEVKLVTKAPKKVVHKPDCSKGTPAFHPLKTPEAYFTCLAKAGQ